MCSLTMSTSHCCCGVCDNYCDKLYAPIV